MQLNRPAPILLLAGASALSRQIFATKSIDKLISESERPEHALKKMLGPVSLTALGIGAAIGPGIFTVIGTAIGANPGRMADWKGPQILDRASGWAHPRNGGRPDVPGPGSPL